MIENKNRFRVYLYTFVLYDAGYTGIPVNCKGQILPREGNFFLNFLVSATIAL